MKILLSQITRERLTVFLSWALMAGLIYSPFLLSVSMIGLLVVGLFQVHWESRIAVGLNPGVKKIFKRPDLLAVTLFFMLVLVSGVMTEDLSYWLGRLRIRMPFLVLPFAFAGLPVFAGRRYAGLFYFLLVLLTVTCVGIGINYLLHFEEINQLMKQGKPMPTPRNHIRFSLLLALGILGGAWLYWKRRYLKYTWEPRLILGMTLFLAFFIHLLSVRSGLLSFYGAIAIWAAGYVYHSRRYGVGLAVLFLLILLPIGAYYFIPSFKAKVDYTRYDMWLRAHGKEEAVYSDTGRLTSLRIGIQIGNAHPVFGVGAGNLRREVDRVYEEQYPAAVEHKMPHNQLVSVYAGTGLTGVSVFLFAFFFPLWYRRRFNEPLFLAHHAIVFLSFLTENTIENSLGVGFYVFFLLTGLRSEGEV